MINSKKEATQAVESVYYPPIGKRGVGLYRAQNYGVGFEDYKKRMSNQDAIIIAQIEHIDGVNNIEEIIQINGIDGILIGPYDLSASLGIPGKYDEPVVQNVLAKMEQACLSNNKTLGYHVIEPDSSLIIEKQKAGYNFIAFSTDFFFLGRKASEEMNKLKSHKKTI